MSEFNSEQPSAMSVKANRIPRIRDALVGIAYHLPERETFLYPFVDNLLLLFQARVVITIWNQKKGELVFSSLRDPYVELKYSQPSIGSLYSRILNSDYSIRVHHLNDQNSKPEFIEKAADYEVLNELLKQPETSFGMVFFERLVESIESIAQAAGQKRVNIPLEERIELSQDEISRLLEPTRHLTDKILGELAKSPFFRPANSAHDLINLFAVVRVASSSRRRFNDLFDYTAGLLLTHAQRAEISRLFEGGEHELSTLETMLGENDRSIADFIFSSGLVAFSGRVRSNLDFADEGSEEARKRHAAEYRLYKTVILGSPHSQLSAENDLFTFYIPIHVGGIPWIGLFTFTRQFPDVDDESWNHNYHLYRDVLPRVSSQIREGAKQAYTTLLADELTSQLTLFGLKAITAEQLIQSVNAGWQRIAQVYPFDRVRLLSDVTERTQNGRTFDLDVLGGKNIIVEIELGQTFLKRDVKFDLLRPKDVDAACRRALDNYRTATQSLQIQSTAYATHILRIPLLRLGSLSMDLAETKEKEVIRYQIDKLLAFESFANYLVNPIRRADRAPKPQIVSIDDLLARLSDSIEHTLDAYSHISFSGNAAGILNKIRVAETLDKKLWRGWPDTARSVSVEFYPVPLDAAIDGVISNALQYNHTEHPALSFDMKIIGGSVFLMVRNPSSEDDLAKRANDMTQRLNASDWIGLNIIYLSCEACRFVDPVWTVEDGNVLRTTLQIGRIVTEKEE